MELKFTKYQGTGNDFILMDGFGNDWTKYINRDLIQHLCHRHFGIGADGFIIIEPSRKADFRMVYYNSDGNESTMCGNGGRCAALFAKEKKRCGDKCSIEAIDGLHLARIGKEDFVELSMGNVSEIEKLNSQTFILNTGSPHYVSFTNDLESSDILQYGRKIRYSETYRESGINVNLAQIQNGIVSLMTYERGVENETLSCGTGVTATAICASILSPDFKNSGQVPVHTKGGKLLVTFRYNGNDGFTDIWLCGSAVKVFEGCILI